MEKITYKYVDRTVNEVEVNDDFAAFYAEIARKDYNINRKETRRHQSLDKSLEHGWQVTDKNVDIAAEAERNEQTELLHNAIAKLLPQQQSLIYRVYFRYEKIKDIAKETGVSACSISARICRALKKLRKYLC